MLKQLKKIFGFETISAPTRVILAQFSQALRLQKVVLLSQLMGMVSVIVCFHHGKDMTPLIVWVICVLLSFWTGIQFKRRFRADCDKEANVRYWIRAWMGNTIFSGLVWAAAGPLFLFTTQAVDEIVLVAVIVGIVFTSWPVYACWLPSLSVFTIITLAPMLFGLSAAYGLGHLFTSALLIGITAFVLYAGRSLNEVVMLSVTHHMQNERLVNKLKTQKAFAESARRSIAQASQRRAKLFADANHDLRQPLQALGIYLQLLKSQTTGQSRELVDLTETCARSISTLVESVLEVTRIEMATVKVNEETVSVRELFNELGDEFLPITQKNGLVFHCEPVDAFVKTDKIHLTRILRNLLTNAVRYSDHEGAGLWLSASFLSDGRVSIEVRDEGRGISEEEQTKIFDAFYRGEAGKNQAGSFGLGLSIVKGLANRLSIPVTLQSRLGAGSSFRLTLLGTDKEAPEGETVRSAGDVRAVPGRLQGTVVLIEDNPELRTALSMMLENTDVSVMASDQADSEFADQVVAVAENGKLLAVVSDFNLGNNSPNGLDGILAMRGGSTVPIPAVLLTAVSPEVIRDHFELCRQERPGEKLRMPVILQKPSTIEALLEAIETARVAEGF